MNWVRKRLTYANVMSSIAVFLVLGGGAALAASHLAKNSVGSKQLKKNSVTAAKIKKGAVTGAKIAGGAVSTPQIANGAVQGGKLSNSAVTSEKIADGSVTTTKINNGAVTGAKLAAGAVGSSNLAPGAVGAGNLATNSVGNSQTQLAKVFKGGAVPAAANLASAPKIELGSVGPFNFYGKCFLEGGEVNEVTYIELTSGVATLDSEDAAHFDSNTTGYLTQATPESEREMEEEASAGPNSFSAESSDEEFQASASDGTEITGLIGGTGAKQGNPPAGNGPFLAGDSCIVGAVAIFGA